MAIQIPVSETSEACFYMGFNLTSCCLSVQEVLIQIVVDEALKNKFTERNAGKDNE